MIIFTNVGCPDPTRFFIKNVWTDAAKDKLRTGIPGASYEKPFKAYSAPLENLDEAIATFPDARWNPDLMERSKALKMQEKQILDIKQLKDAELEIPGLKSPNGFKLRPLQKVGVRFLQGGAGILREQGITGLAANNGAGGILAMDVGVGKSLTSEAYALDLINRGLIDRIYVICPAPLKYSVWAKELEKWTSLSYIVIDGETPVEVETETEEEVWELDDKGKRKWIMEPTYKMEIVHFRELKISKYHADDQFQREALTFDARGKLDELLGPKDEVVGIDIDGQLIAENMEPYYYVRAHVKRYKRDKKTYLKKKTGRIVPTVEKWSGRKLREVQYYQDPAEHRVMINNYENFLSDIAFMDDSTKSVYERSRNGYTLDPEKTIMPLPTERDLVIIDEAHRIKNRDAKSSIRIWKWSAFAGYRVLLTANPLENNIEEFYNLVNLVRPGLLGTWSQYKERYIFTDAYGRSTGQPNPQLIPELKRKTAPIMYRVTKKQALPELLDVVEQFHWVDMTEYQRSLYQKVQDGILEQYNEFGAQEFKYLDQLSQITRFQQCCDHTELYRRILSNPEIPSESGKMLELYNILDDIGVANHKFLIFNTYREVTDIIHRELTAKYGPWFDFIYIKGGNNSKDTAALARKFREDPKTRFAIITLAGNYGIDLFDESGTSDGDYVINFNQHFNPQKMRQVIGRMHRGGQKGQVTAINLGCRDSYEERKKQKMDEKRNVFDAVIEEGSLSDEAVMKLFTQDDLAYMMFGSAGAQAGTARASAQRDARLERERIEVVDTPPEPRKGPPRATATARIGNSVQTVPLPEKAHSGPVIYCHDLPFGQNHDWDFIGDYDMKCKKCGFEDVLPF